MNLKEIQKPVADLLEKTDAVLRQELRSNIKLINEMSDSTPVSRGKKIRSTLLFLLAGLNNSLPPDLPSIAASIEMFHLSSLIHDDVVDNSEFRRGRRTLNSNFGNFISVLWGDFLFIHSLNNFYRIHKEFLDIILRSAKSMIEGQILEVENTCNYDINLETYFDIIKKKTSSLFAGIAEMVSALKGSPSFVSKELCNFGLHFGTIFQISDDMLDIFSENSGKDRFRDLKEGKITLPIILLLKKDQREVIENFSEDRKEHLLRLIKKFKIEESSLSRIKEYSAKCTSFLDTFPDSVYKESLLNLLKFIVYRDY